MNLKEAYLRCKYWKDKHIALFQNEHIIRFKSYSRTNPLPLIGEFLNFSPNEDWCIIDKNDLIKKDDENGFAQVIICPSAEREKMLVAITNAAEHRISIFHVPKTEIVCNIGSKTKNERRMLLI